MPLGVAEGRILGTTASRFGRARRARPHRPPTLDDVTLIGPDGPLVGPPALAWSPRQPSATGFGPGSTIAGAALASGLDWLGQTPSAPFDPRSVILGGGPHPSARAVLSALRGVLLESSGDLEQLVGRIVALVAERPAGAGVAEPAAGPVAARGTGPVAASGRHSPAAIADLRALLPSQAEASAEALTRALTWLVDNLDRPRVVTEGCAQFAPALAGLGVPPERVEGIALLLIEGAQAQALALAWPPERLAAWRDTARLLARWMAQEAEAAAYLPPYWTGTVIDHDSRRRDLAILQIRTFLPYRYVSGQYAVVASEHHPEVWRACWIGTAPSGDNVVELHVRSSGDDPVGLALVGRTSVGDRLRLGPAEGPVLAGWAAEGDLLLVAVDTGIAPMKALLAEVTRDGGHRADLLWLVPPNEEPYDLDAVAELSGPAGTVTTLSAVGDLAATLDARDTARYGAVYVAGEGTGVAAALTALAFAGVPADRVTHAVIGPDD